MPTFITICQGNTVMGMRSTVLVLLLLLYSATCLAHDCRDVLPGFGKYGNCKEFKDAYQCDKPWVASFCQRTCQTCDLTPDSAQISDANVALFYTNSVAEVAKKLIKLTPPEQKQVMLFPYDSPARYVSKNASVDPRFAAAFARSPAWGLPQCNMSFPQLVTLHELLNAALSPAGYQMIVSIMNHQVIIGEMEDTTADKTNVIADITQKQIANNDNTLYPDTTAATEANDINSAVTPVAVAGAVTQLNGSLSLNWTWAKAPGSAVRITQFCGYSLALFGTPKEGRSWGFRFEGHHISVNFDSRVKRKGSKRPTVSLTPILLGSFPMVVTPSPDPQARLTSPWALSAGQRLLADGQTNLRDMWLSISKKLRLKAFVPTSAFPQVIPLENDVPSPNGFFGLYSNNSFNPDTTPHVNLTVLEMSGKTKFYMYSYFDMFLSTLNGVVSESIKARMTDALEAGTKITLFWAGGDLTKDFTNHYSYIKAGPFQFEYLQSGQFVVSYPGYDGNHVHTMLRDLEYKWDFNPMEQHIQAEHSGLGADDHDHEGFLYADDHDDEDHDHP